MNENGRKEFYDLYLDSLKKDSGLKLLSLEQLAEYAKNLLNQNINKEDYCERTYVKPRLQRVPDKLKFLDDLIQTFEGVIQSDFSSNFESWSSGEYYFLTSGGQFDLTITDDGTKVKDVDHWYEIYERSLDQIYNENLFEFLDELRYLIYIKNEKKRTA